MQIHKTYYDFMTDDGTLFVLYTGHVTALRKRWAFAALEVYAPGQKPRVLRTGRTSVQLSPNTASVRFPKLNLAFTARFADLKPVDAIEVLPSLHWHIVSPRTTCELDWNGQRYTGTGYIDEVRMGHSPTYYGLRELRWGRIHLANETRVFNDLQTAKGQRYMQTMTWQPDLHCSDAVELPQSDQERILHKGPALNKDRIPAAPVRWTLNALSGRPVEKRCLQQSPDRQVLYEDVSFSR